MNVVFMTKKDFGDVFMKPFQNIPVAAFPVEEMETLLEKPFDGYVISIRDPGKKAEVMYKLIDERKDNCKGMLALEFEDADFEFPGHRVPEKEDMEKILSFTKKINLKKHKIAVHCTAGVSRSSAAAYIIACSKMPIEEALGCLDKKWHDPNWRMVAFGAEILGNNKIYYDAYDFIPKSGGYLN